MSMIQIMDENILIWIENNIRMDELNPIIKVFTSLGNMGLIWIIVAIMLLCNKSTRKIGVYTTFAIFFKRYSYKPYFKVNCSKTTTLCNNEQFYSFVVFVRPKLFSVRTYKHSFCGRNCLAKTYSCKIT